MAAQLGYVTLTTDEDGNEVPELKAFEQYMTPVYSKEDSTTKVTFELTDYLYTIKEGSINTNAFVITTYDYALNYATYEIGMPDEYVDFYFDSLEEEITLSPNEVYSLEPLVYPEGSWAELLEFTSSKPSVVRVVNNKIVAVASGSAAVKVRDPATNKAVTFKVKVLDEEDEGYRRYDKPVADVFELQGYTTQKAFYQLSGEDKKIGDTGNTRFFEGNFNLEMYPSESVVLNYDLDAFFPNDTTVEFESSNENIVSINEYGQLTANAEGFASVTIKVMMDGRSTYYSETVSVEVMDPYVTTGATLTHYFGNGGVVTIPERLSLREIGAFAFSNFDYVEKTAEELAFDDAENTKQWFIGESSITKVVIPEGVKKINAYAFANLTGLEEVVLPSTLGEIDYGAFYNCTSLEKITFPNGNNLKVINQNAFENCNLQGTLDLSAVCMIADYAFAGNMELEGVATSDTLLSIGQYAFAGCKDLTDVTITAPKVKYGTYAFTGCESLKSFYVNAAVLPEGMFYEAENLESVTIGPDVNDIGEFAFRDTKVTSFTVESGNKAYKAQTADYILSADGATLVAVSPEIKGEFTNANIGGAKVSAIAKGAFSHNTDVTSVVLPEVTAVGDYAFGSSEDILSVSLGTLTEIGEYAFFETGITELPQFTAETEIGKYAFSFTDITSVNIPDGMTIAEGVFAECLKLESVTIGNDVTVGKYAFQVSVDNAYSVENYDEEISVGGSVAVEDADQGEDAESAVEVDDANSMNADDGIEGKEEVSAQGATVTEKFFYYTFATALKELTIGNNAVIGDNAFANNACLETVTLGEDAQIGYMSFYNNSSLKNIDLSKVRSIGDYAFSGDVYYVCVDDSMAYAAVSTDGHYIYTYHAPAIEKAELLSTESIGEYAFAYCRDLAEVVLNDNITEIKQYTFAGCEGLTTIDLGKIVTVADYAFIENKSLAQIDLSAAETIGQYAFVYGESLTSVVLNPNGVEIAEGAFSYCEQLGGLDFSEAITNVGPYAFAYTGITAIDLSGAEVIDDMAFLKAELTPFSVVLGEDLETLGDNPFAMCDLEPFCIVEVKDFNGMDTSTATYTYDISDTVHVIDGSLYCDTVNGMELIAYAGTETVDVKVADDTVRITAHAFAGSDVQMVTLPYTVTAIGHKAFYGCDDLKTVVFGSYYAPILEEEFDNTYYESLEHIPGTGDFGTYEDYNGETVTIEAMGLLPWYMWNATGGMYSNVFYGANFVDYVGYVENKLTMIRPANGENYDGYVYSQYFDLAIDGAYAPDDAAVAAINAIKAIPERVTYEDKDQVEAARAAYTKIATTLQQALVTNYADLISAEQRITALTPTEEGEAVEGEAEETQPTDTTEPAGNGGFGMVLGLPLAAAAGGACFMLFKRRKAAPAEEAPVVIEEAPEEEAAVEEIVAVEEIPSESEE